MKRSEAERILKPFLVSGPMENGDWDARCPLHEDNKRSARINFDKSQWVCFAGCGGGRLSVLLKRMGEETPAVAPRPKGSTKRKRPPATENDVVRWHRELFHDSISFEYLWHRRGIDRATARTYRLGLDRQAFTIPIYKDGELFNVRQYDPDPGFRNRRTKIWWYSGTLGEELPLYPESVIDESDALLLCEGEMDALLANQEGIPAITGTAGADHWYPHWSKKLAGKTVYIAYDRDRVGERSATMVAEALENYAAGIFIVKIPIKKKGADVSDFFLAGNTKDDFKEVIRSALPYQKRNVDPTLMEPIASTVMDTFSSQNVGRHLTMDAHISGRLSRTYEVPKMVRSSCTQDAGAKCAMCPMNTKWEGELVHEVQPWSPTVLRIREGNEVTRANSLRLHIGAVKCDRLSHEVLTYQTVEQLQIRPSLDADSSETYTERAIYSVGKHDTLPSQVVRIDGTPWPDPTNQSGQFLAWSVRESESALDEFAVTPETIAEMRTFQPDERHPTPLRKLWSIAGEYERHVTRILGRRDLHVGISLIYHSALSFSFRGRIEERGWLDGLIIGDTRTGKSEAAAKMAEWYGVGQVVNCESATYAGVVAGLKQVGGTRDWTISWGAIPMNDRRLVILDEVSGLAPEQIAQMSDIRSRGVALIQKIQTEQARARTRLLWLSNPRDGGMDRFTYGVQAIAPLIGNPEDIARFDFALALRSDDVGLRTIHSANKEGRESAISEEAARSLVMWVWSRTPDDISWDDGAEEMVIRAAEWMGKQYSSDPPLIQAANVRLKIARLAVALAGATFSTENGRRLIVRETHVKDAVHFLHGIYKKESFGYYQMSKQQREQSRRAVANWEDAKDFLMANPTYAQFFRDSGGVFRREMLEQATGLRREEANGVINKLYLWSMVRMAQTEVELTPVFQGLLREFNGRGGRFN